jgi:hypothetical protein
MAENENTESNVEEQAPVQDIIRGRMPLPIVHIIKFDEKGTDGEVAKKFRTTNGKVSDIRKNRNFGYITDEFVPTQEMIDGAKVYAEQLDDESVLAAVNDITPATDEQAKAFADSRKGSRTKAAPAETAAESTAGGDEGAANVADLIED